jgi:hypothetical protein
MIKTIRLVNVEQGVDGMTVTFDDKSFTNRDNDELIAYAQEQLEQATNAMLRSLLLLDWVTYGVVGKSATLDSDQAQGQWVLKNG